MADDKLDILRWSVYMDQDFVEARACGPSTGEPPSIEFIDGRPLCFSCDARDREHAVKIARDELAEWWRE